jgi:hypothetical protein
MIKWPILLMVLSTSLNCQSAPLPVKFQSTIRQISLLELYSSEGCSSCPPADEWFSGLKSAKGLWHDFVPVSWHVDYWNYLGWRDPWSNEDFSERQRAYAALWHSDSIYTPCLVLNGQEWHPWFRPGAGPSASGAEVGTLTVESTERKNWHVEFRPVQPVTEHYQIHAALLASGLSSDVKAGENNGRHLTHDFVVLSSADTYLPGYTNVFHGDLTLDATQTQTNGPTAVAFWVTRINQLEPLQAVGGWLDAPSGSK